MPETKKMRVLAFGCSTFNASADFEKDHFTPEQLLTNLFEKEER